MIRFRTFVEGAGTSSDLNVQSRITLKEWNGWIHKAAGVEKFGHEAAAERKRITGQDYHNYDPHNPLDSEAVKHMHKYLSTQHKHGVHLDTSNPHHVHALATEARRGWAKGVMKLDANGQAKQKEFSNGYKLSRHDNAKMALKNPDPERLKQHLIKKGVPEDEAHSYSHDYDGVYGKAAANVFNHNRNIK